MWAMRILRKNEYENMLEKIEDQAKKIEELKATNFKYKNIFGRLHAIFKYYRNNRCGATKLITNISYVIGLGDIPDKYKILKEE